jgi:hypothetical protein
LQETALRQLAPLGAWLYLVGFGDIIQPCCQIRIEAEASHDLERAGLMLEPA